MTQKVFVTNLFCIIGLAPYVNEPELEIELDEPTTMAPEIQTIDDEHEVHDVFMNLGKN